jgi:deferrochelatase/peroxidase EfeB
VAPDKGGATAGEGTLSTEQRESLKAVRRHRLIRRSAAYTEGPDGAGEEERGLMFVALNASLGRQFEFVQRSWLLNEKIGTAVDERDPLLARCEGARFTIPASPIRRVVQGLAAFVRTMGGGYFFLPGRCALLFLADLRE